LSEVGKPQPEVAKGVDEMLREIVRKLEPALVDLVARGESGEFALRFRTGQLKQVVRKEVVL
jgi:hypothetical protein